MVTRISKKNLKNQASKSKTEPNLTINKDAENSHMLVGYLWGKSES